MKLLKTLATWLARLLPRSLEVQLMLLTSACLVLAIMGYGTYRANEEVSEARHSVSERMVGMAKNIATMGSHFLSTNEPASVEPLLLQLATVDGIYSVLVTDLAGTPITEVVNKNLAWSPRYNAAQVNVPDPSQPDSVLTIQPHNAVQRDYLAGTAGTMTAWQRVNAERPLGWIRINYRLDTFDAITSRIYLQAAKSMAVATLITLLLMALLLRPRMRALRQATEFAGRMDTSMGDQIKVSTRATEIEALANALNVVSERLLAQHTDLNNQKSALDQHAIVSITDLAGNITYANQRFCDVSGYSVDELVGQNHRIVKSDEHPPALFEDMWHTITQGKVWRGDVKNQKKTGSFFWVNATIVPLIGRDGLPQQYIGIRTDITANKAMEARLQIAREQAESATLSKGQFLANTSHEIRTPMNAVLGMLHLLHNTELSKSQRDYAIKAEGAAQSLLGLINDILDFSKIEASKMTLDAHPFRLDKLLRNLSVIVSANLGDKPVEILFDLDPGIPKNLVGDALRLQQVLINLVSNAIKFTPRGEVVVRIKQTLGTATRVNLHFAVQDSGIGIAPENQQRIFDGFSQAEASTTRRFGGTGLGLSICRALVTLMGGELGLQSTLGQGSTFSFNISLPVALDSAPRLVPAWHTQPPADLRVLVVDDNATARELLRSMINSLGWQVDTAESGEAAVALLKNRAKNGQLPFQAMFIDWQMPDKDGWQTIQELHAESTTQEPPITIMVSAQGRELLGQRSPEEHARLHGFLMKPVTASMLFDAVSDALASRSAPAPELVLQETVKPLQGLRLLVVEDNLINQQIAMEMLSNEGADVTLADNGQLGVDAVFQASLSDHPFDAVLMDIQMPVMDGYSATRMLREDASLTSLPIIAMTANAMASDREACLAAGMNEHVGKPFNLKQLVSLLQKLTQTDIAPVGSPTPTHSTPHEPPLPPTDALDVGAALERLGGNEALYAQVLTTFLNDLATQPAKLTHCLQQADYNGATRLLHTLKGLAATVGASYLAAVARKAELTLKTSTRAHAETGTLTLDQKTLCRDIEAAVITTQNILGTLVRRYAAPLSAPTMADTSGDISGADLAQLNQLQTFLKASNMQATTVFEQILSRGTLGERPDFQRLRSAMAAFDFQEAVSACEHLVQGADK